MGKIAITTSAGCESFSLSQRLYAYREAGFDSVMLWLGRRLAGMSPVEQFAVLRSAGMNVENCHGDCGGINSIWLPGDEGDRFITMCMDDIETCARNDVSIYIFHLSSGLPAPSFSDVGQARLDKMIRFAENCGVQIAFENLRSSALLQKVMSLFSSPSVGFCFDSGHQHCFTPDTDWLSLYSDRLLAVHLHDNCGDRDAHLLPGDGSICFPSLCKKLKSCSFSRAIGIETETFLTYAEKGVSFPVFLRRAYEAGEKFQRGIHEK